MSDSEQPRETYFPLTNNSGKLNPELLDDVAEAHRPVKVTVARRPTNPLWTATKWIVGVSLCVGAMGAGAVLNNFASRNKVIGTVVQGIINNPLQVIVQRDPLVAFTPDQQFTPDKQHTLNILLMGCDNEFAGTLDAKGYVRWSPVLDSPGRSDALMLARVDFDAKTIKILSIPRDTRVAIPRHGTTKINAANAMGGPDLAKETITNVFGVPIDYYVTLHFDGFKKVVDALGGVDVDVKKDIDFVDHCAGMDVHLKPGFQHLNGYKAMGYVRFRHTDSDLARADRQHEFLEALKQKAMNPKTLWKLPEVLSALTDNLKSDMTIEQMMTLANFARSIDKQNIEVATLPSVEGPSFVYMKRREASEVVSRMFGETGGILAYNAPDASEAGLYDEARPRRRHSRLVSGDDEPRPGRRSRRHRRNRHSDSLSIPAISSPDSSGDPGTPEAPSSGDTGGSGSGNSSSPSSSPEPAAPSGGDNPSGNPPVS